MSRFPLMSLALCSSLIASLATGQSARGAKALESNAASYGLEAAGGDRDAKGTDADRVSSERRGAKGIDDKTKGIDPLDRRDSKGLEPDAGSVGVEPGEGDRVSSERRGAKDIDDKTKGIDPLGRRDSKGLEPDAGSVGVEPGEGDRVSSERRGAKDIDDKTKGIDPLGHTTKDTDPEGRKQVFEIFEGDRAVACVRVTAYGQRAAGIDMRENGKLLRLSFRMAAERVGVVQVAGGEPGRPYGLLLGAQRAEHRLPWDDTVLVAQPLAVAAGKFDADGKARIQLNLAGVAAIAAADLHLYMQAFAALSRPVTSHGLEFAACGAAESRDWFGLDGDRRVKDIDELRSRASLRNAVGLDSGSKKVGSIGTDAYETYPFEAALAMAKGKSDELWLGAWVTVPTTGFDLRHDGTIHRGSDILVLFSVVAPAAGDLVAPVIEERGGMLPLGTIGGKRVLVFVADRVRGDESEAHYGLAAVL